MRDVIVIGAGGGGAVVAKELAAHGLSVLVLEAGPRHLRLEKAWRQLKTAASGRDEETVRHAAGKLGIPGQKTKDALGPGYGPQENAILQPHGTAGRTSDASKLVFPKARGCTFCGYCFQGCFEPRHAPRNLFAKRSTDNSYVPMALTADAWSKHGKRVALIADAFATKIGTTSAGGKTVANSVTWRVGRTGETFTEEAKVMVTWVGTTENQGLWLNSGTPNPNHWAGDG